jgi:hypothetical protein
MNIWSICWFFTHIFTGILIFKGLTVGILYKLFGVKGLIGGWSWPKSRPGRFLEESNVFPQVEIEIFMVRVGRGAQIPGASSQ